MSVERVEIGDAVLWHGDCRDVSAEAKADVLISDPPYGVGLTEKRCRQGDGRTKAHPVSYGSFLDDEDAFRALLPIIGSTISTIGRAALFCGTRRITEYPPAADMGGIFVPAGAGIGRWGFCCFHPVLFYGKPPRNERYPSSVRIAHPGNHVTDEQNDHPCPKPIAFMLWLIGLASLEGEIVLDPFMGSGTTGVACMQLGRKFIGIEIERRWFDIACRRIEEAQRQYRMAL